MKKCLIVVDFQNDFTTGALSFPGGLEIKDRIKGKIKSYRKKGYDVIFTLDSHEDNYLETEEGKNLPIPHCVIGTEGHKLHPEIDSLRIDKDPMFVKYTFPSLDMGMYLKSKNYDEIELCGLVSNICIISNAVIAKAALPNAHIIVDALATDSYDKDLHTKSLDVMRGLHVEVLNYE